ncbi:hypothetical protein EHW99_0794 [Erwinia amylovora]|nr:hypothetical protein EHX00_0794 [Erwinia amylovora]QJQ57199.1 hypothetical protein EHW99_0794 [Erwinia amylovora]QJQ60898.1 hypothetical protein EHW98_0794 [Erwinia amylovora]QJQ64700.1 hypothetical protein EHW96_0794 [Erwinia amylovora]QJQ68399.1 hypothetical protein EGZ89_0794 [Erwinia amylovora]
MLMSPPDLLERISVNVRNFINIYTLFDKRIEFNFAFHSIQKTSIALHAEPLSKKKERKKVANSK